MLSEAAPAGRRRSTRRSRTSTPSAAGRLLAAFVDDLSNWYVRRSPAPLLGRRPGGAARRCTSAWTVVTLLLAPLTPFVTERVWQDVVARRSADGAPDSVHLASLADGRRRRWSTTASPRRWRWSAGWSSWAARPAAAVQGAHPPAAGAGAGRRRPAGPALPAELRRRGRRRAQRRAARRAVRRRRAGRRHAPRPTSARWASGSASGRRRSPRPSPRPTPPRWPRRCAAPGRPTVVVDGEPVEVSADDVRRHRDPARGLGGRRPTAARPSRSTWTITPELRAGRAGPRGRPAGPGGPQDQRPAR